MLANPDEWRSMRVAARQEYEKHYSPEPNYETLMRIYEWAVAQTNTSQLGHSAARDS
jgi:hypothetical protein